MAGSKLTALTDLAGGQVSTDLAYVVDVSAGASGSKKSTLNDLFEQITKNITDAVVKGIAGSGSNSAGSNLGLSGGLGTGTGTPGAVVVRYPLIGASGSTLQSLSQSSDAFHLTVDMYTVTAGSTVANTTSETSIFVGTSAPTASAGSTRTLQGGIMRAGTLIRVLAYGTMTRTGTPTFRIRAKMGSTTIADTGVITISADGHFKLAVEFSVTAIGATGGVNAIIHFMEGTGTPQAVTVNILQLGTASPFDWTANQDIDVTVQWSAASASNNFSPFQIAVTRER